MDESSNSDYYEQNVCLICDKIRSNLRSGSDLGEIIKVTRGIVTLKAASEKVTK